MLPSKKIIAIGAGCVLILGLVIRTTVSKNDLAAQNKIEPVVPEQLTTSDTVRNKLLSKIAESANETSSTTNQNSITKNISQDFAQNYLVLKSKGTLTTQNEAQLIQNLTTTYATTSTLSFSLNDIQSFSDLNKEKTHIFGNTVAKIVISYYKSLKSSPIDILDNAHTTNSTSTVPSSLKPIAKSYRLLALDLQKVPAPANIAASYLQVVNGYAHLADDVDNMSVFFSDSVRGFIGINNYQQDASKQIELLKTVADYFTSNGILFSNTDSGKIWNSLTQ